MYTIEILDTLAAEDLRASAVLTAAAFGRLLDNQNYNDTKEHIIGADHVQFARDEAGQLVGFAAYRYLWRRCR